MSLARRLESWRDDLAARLATGEDPPSWAATLGAAPADPGARQTWAAAVAQVALYRVVHRVEGDSLLGPDVALGTPASRARVTAQAAAATAEELATSAPYEPGRRPLAPTGPRRPPPSAEPSQRPSRS